MRSAWLALTGVFVVACGSDPDGSDPGSSGSGGSGGGPSSGAGGTGAVLEPTEPSNPEHGGLVMVVSGTLHSDGMTLDATMGMALFFDAPGATVGECTTAIHGSCEVTRCEGGTGAASTESVSAGEITITGKQSLSLVPDADGSYEMMLAAGPLWDPGQTVTVSAAGDTVPAFDHTAAASSPVTITSPALPAMEAPMVVERTEDFTMTWSGGTSGAVTTMWKASGSDPFVSVRCVFPASDGEGTVPAAAMEAFPAGASGSLLVVAGHIDTLEAGEYSVQVNLNSIASWGEGNGNADFTVAE